MVEELSPVNMAANVAVQTVELRHIKESLERIELSLGSHVTRNEWEMRNGYVDGQFVMHASQITKLHSDIQDQEKAMESRRAPWWAVGSVIVAGASLLWLILGPAIIALP